MKLDEVELLFSSRHFLEIGQFPSDTGTMSFKSMTKFYSGKKVEENKKPDYPIDFVVSSLILSFAIWLIMLTNTMRAIYTNYYTYNGLISLIYKRDLEICV